MAQTLILQFSSGLRRGRATFFNAYAPHGGHDYNVRQTHYSEVGRICSSTNSFGVKVLVGNMNAKIHNNIGGEGSAFGEHCFGNEGYDPQIHPDANREILLELCVSAGLCVANTF